MNAHVLDIGKVPARHAWRWISLGLAAAAIGGVTLQLVDPPVSLRTYDLNPPITLPASLYFDAGRTALDDEGHQSILAIASLAKSSPTPVVVAAYADPLGNRDRNLQLAQKRAAGVRDALVMAGVPTLRVVLVSPTFADTDNGRRVEISSVHGVRAFPAQRGGTLAR
jgi:outer membrane protein OmpA-like peptidoglycan-associated protein